MKATAVLLGTGTSTGVPIPGKLYSPEFLAEPKNHRLRPALLLKGPLGNLLVDCGPDLRMQLLREQVLMLDAVVITHTHADHVMGMDDLRSYCSRQGRPMPIYTDPPYQEDIRRIFPYAFREFPPGIEIPRFDLFDAPDELSVGGMSVRLFHVSHGAQAVLAFRLGGFAYVTDVKSIPAESRRWVEDLETLVLDAVRFKPHRNHLNLEEALDLIAELKPRQTFLTHLSDDFDVTQPPTLPPGVELAYDGLQIEIEF